MSDLQCPATLLVVRHGQARYVRPGGCDVDDGRLTQRGRRQAAALATAVRRRAVSTIYTSSMPQAVETGAVLAERLTLTCRPLPGVQEFSVGSYGERPDKHALVAAVFAQWLGGDLAASCPGGENAATVVSRFAAAVDGVADLHRGETVIIVSHGGAMALAIPRLCHNAARDLARVHWIPNCSVAEFDVDADGWRLRSWPSSRDRDAAEPHPSAG